MSSKSRIYLDNAATSWPKPESVYEAIDQYQRDIGAAAGRAGYRDAEQANRTVENVRTACAKLFRIANPSQIAFTANGTDALNKSIHGLLKPGDHVVTTVCEHNSVLRPLGHEAANNGVTVSYVDCDSQGFIAPDEIARAIQPNTRFVAVNHASNVTGAVQPLAEIADIAHQGETLLLVDAAQTAGCVPIDVEQQNIDVLATGGHKGLLGPLGTGVLYLREDLSITPLLQGGTGSESQSEIQPSVMPQLLESGNLNVPALAGLGAAIKFLEDHPKASRLSELTKRLLTGLSDIQGLRIFGPQTSKNRVCVVSFAVEGYDPQEFATALDAMAGIECRAGLHCAPRMHHALGSIQSGGLVRLSPGWATTNQEIDQALEAIQALASVSDS